MTYSPTFASADPRNLRAVPQKFVRLLFHMFCCAFAGGFSAHAFLLKSTFTDFGGVGLCRWLERPCGRW